MGRHRWKSEVKSFGITYRERRYNAIQDVSVCKCGCVRIRFSNSSGHVSQYVVDGLVSNYRPECIASDNIKPNFTPKFKKFEP